jgi:hypothetical protein
MSFSDFRFSIQATTGADILCAVDGMKRDGEVDTVILDEM